MSRNCRTCVACGVKEYGTYKANIFFTTFPLDENRCREWIRLVGEPELVFLPIEKLHEKKYVCGQHFEKKSFNKKGNRLRKTAVPKLNLPSTPLSEEQLQEFPQHMWNHESGNVSQTGISNRKRTNSKSFGLEKKREEAVSSPKKLKEADNTGNVSQTGISIRKRTHSECFGLEKKREEAVSSPKKLKEADNTGNVSQTGISNRKRTHSESFGLEKKREEAVSSPKKLKEADNTGFHSTG